MRFSLMVGLAFTLAAWLIPEVLMSIYTSEPEVISEGCKYLRIVAVAYIPISITTIYLNIMRSVERVVISTVVYLISLVTNVILNAVFIFGLFGLPAMGIMGAALATMIARFVELAIVLFYSKKMNRTIRFRISDLFVRDGFLFRDFLRYSIPVVLNELMWGAGASMNSAVIGHLGSAATAANSVAQVTRQLATVVAFGIANAAAIMIGKAIGAGDVERAKNYGARFTKLTLLAGVAGAVVVLIVRPIVMASMTLSPEAEGYLSMMMLVMSYFVIGQAYNTTMVVGVFRAGGDTRFGLALDVISMWCCSILLGAIAAFVLKWSVPVVYIILMSDEVLKVPFTTWRYKTRVWLKNVTR